MFCVMFCVNLEVETFCHVKKLGRHLVQRLVGFCVCFKMSRQVVVKEKFFHLILFLVPSQARNVISFSTHFCRNLAEFFAESHEACVLSETQRVRVFISDL